MQIQIWLATVPPSGISFLKILGRFSKDYVVVEVSKVHFVTLEFVMVVILFFRDRNNGVMWCILVFLYNTAVFTNILNDLLFYLIFSIFFVLFFFFNYNFNNNV